jgi:hypothetical protein
MIIQSNPRKQLYYMKGAGIGNFLKSLVQPEVIKGHLKHVGKLLLEKAKLVARDVLKPALKQAAVDVGQVVSSKAKQKLRSALAPERVEEKMKNLAEKTQQPLVKETIQKLTPTLSDASRKLLSNLIGSGIKNIPSKNKWRRQK